MKSAAAALSILLSTTEGYRTGKGVPTVPAVDPEDRNLCPVLAALHRNGDLNSDENGVVEIKDIFDGLHYGLGIERNLSLFQAFGITGYAREQVDGEMVHRDRCIPGETPTGTSCFVQRFLQQENAAKQEFPLGDDTKRYLNLFEMNGKQVVEHGVSSGVRGGGTNMPPGLVEHCNGVFPCEYLFKKFFLDNAQPDGRIYTENLMKAVCLMRQIGDRGGEHSHRSGEMTIPLTPPQLTVVSSEWQAKGALTAMLQAFGRWDDIRKERYLTAPDLRAIMMDATYPEGWAPRPNGCIFAGCDVPALSRWRTPIENCPVAEPNIEAFWKGSFCETRTGRTCSFNSDCNDPTHEDCLNGYCTCQRSAGKTMCYQRGGDDWSMKCRAQANTCEYFGEHCKPLKADFPEVPGNTDIVETDIALTRLYNPEY